MPPNAISGQSPPLYIFDSDWCRDLLNSSGSVVTVMGPTTAEMKGNYLLFTTKVWVYRESKLKSSCISLTVLTLHDPMKIVLTSKYTVYWHYYNVFYLSIRQHYCNNCMLYSSRPYIKNIPVIIPQLKESTNLILSLLFRVHENLHFKLPKGILNKFD